MNLSAVCICTVKLILLSVRSISGVHWLVMTMWVIQQKTDFCPSRLEEVFYNCVVGVIYCFCFFNLREGQARYRMIAFYAVMVSQNFICLLLFLFLHPGAMNRDLVIITSSIIISGTFLGKEFFLWPSQQLAALYVKRLTSINIDKAINANLGIILQLVPKPHDHIFGTS